MKLKITIEMDNAAFEVEGEERLRDAGEAARILRALTVGWPGTPLQLGDLWALSDLNGNRVGEAKVVR